MKINGKACTNKLLSVIRIRLQITSFLCESYIEPRILEQVYFCGKNYVGKRHIYNADMEDLIDRNNVSSNLNTEINRVVYEY